MKATETTVLVTADGKANLQLPPDILPGEYRIVLVIDKQVLHQSSKQESTKSDFPLIHAGPWATDLPLRREEMYGDNGR